jgi:hypothetical protein
MVFAGSDAPETALPASNAIPTGGARLYLPWPSGW